VLTYLGLGRMVFALTGVAAPQAAEVPPSAAKAARLDTAASKAPLPDIDRRY
jgi:hypothetical protein